MDNPHTGDPGEALDRGPSWLVRAGPLDRWDLASLSEIAGGPVEAVDGGVRLAAPGRDLQALAAEFDEPAVRSAFAALAARLQDAHGRGQVVGALDLTGVRWSPEGLRLLPVLNPSVQDTAPETERSPASDWYIFGHLLYRVLTRGALFAGHGASNGPDPRDLRADAPDDLCALVLDVLLVDPAERLEGEEVLEVFDVEPDTAETPIGWLELALERGGLVLRELSPQRDLERGVQEKWLDLGMDLRRIRHAEVLTPLQRTLVSTLLSSPEVLTPAALERAGRWLGLALHSLGVRVLWVHDPTPLQLQVIRAVLRAEAAPLVCLSGSVDDAFLRLCAAEEVPGLTPEDVRSMAFAERAAVPMVERLSTLGVTAATGWSARAITEWERAWTREPTEPTSGDRSVNRQLLRLTSPLIWTSGVRFVSAAAQLQRRAANSGDLDGLASARMLLAWFYDAPNPDLTSNSAKAWQRLTRALRHRRDGRFARVEQALSHQLPFAGAGPTDALIAKLVLAEALIERARLGQARRLLREIRVDARSEGQPDWDVAARALLVRAGAEVVLPEPRGDGLLAIWTLRAASERALRQDDLASAVRFADALQELYRGWPWSRADRAEVDMWAGRLHAIQSGRPVVVPGGHSAGPAWSALARAGRQRREKSPDVHRSLQEAASRFDGANRTLAALATSRMRGLFLGGVRGGTLVEQADAALRSGGVGRIPRFLRGVVPELAL